jgi:hypothetical protein
MRKNKSADDFLRLWAEDPVTLPLGLSEVGELVVREAYARKAYEHGLVAVRVIREAQGTRVEPLAKTLSGVARNEARLAFRAALNAVGLKGALDCRPASSLAVRRCRWCDQVAAARDHNDPYAVKLHSFDPK